MGPLLANRLPSARHSCSRSPFVYCLISFLVLYFLLIQYCRTHFYRDPTSSFFDSRRAYDQVYSGFRSTQATRFIYNIDALADSWKDDRTASLNQTDAWTASKNASVCVGIASVAREGVSYIEGAVGSLLMDLGPDERDDIYLILFIPHADPTVHPSYSSRWLFAMADKVLLYNEEDLGFVKELENHDKLGKTKALFDYVYLLKACEAVGTPYVLMLEDDVVALDGWHHRTKHALDAAEQQTRQLGASGYLYLRLFYTHKFLGWNKEELPTYLFYSLLTVLSVGTLLLLARRYAPASPLHRLLSNEIILFLTFVGTPLCIILFFSAGRASMLPIPPGVHSMPRFGCCSQALVFPHSRVADVISWYESKQQGFADSLLEEYANSRDELRWALTPSVFQHVGVVSSKYDDQTGTKRRAAKSIWNFEFEDNDPMALQREHERAREIAAAAAQEAAKDAGE
ncbi:hypothetical protein VTO42DRAFT_777 [Malbranchea cinnamomea]